MIDLEEQSVSQIKSKLWIYGNNNISLKSWSQFYFEIRLIQFDPTLRSEVLSHSKRNLTMTLKEELKCL
jgi:hypothetical protein